MKREVKMWAVVSDDTVAQDAPVCPCILENTEEECRAAYVAMLPVLSEFYLKVGVTRIAEVTISFEAKEARK